jgi:methylglutaconyl-CoA hydratase
MNRQLDVREDALGVLTLTLNNPTQHNALGEPLVEELSNALLAAQQRDSVRAVVIEAAGDTFCSGADLECFAVEAIRESRDQRYIQALARLLKILYRLNKITVAMVQGPAYGGGVGLIVCCDIAIGSTAAVLRFPELRLGLIPAVIAPFVVAALGERKARYLFLTAKAVAGVDAIAYGLLNHVCMPTKLAEVTQHEIDALLRSAPQAVAETKSLLRSLSGVHPDDQDTRSWLVNHLRRSPEPQTGIAAALEKRRPQW